MRFNMTAPCAHCPFRLDIHGYLRRGRAEEIASCLLDHDQSFACQETTVMNEETETLEVAGSTQHCAGAMIFLEAQGEEGRPNQIMRIAERIGWYDREKLKMQSPVAKTREEFVEHHG